MEPDFKLYAHIAAYELGLDRASRGLKAAPKEHVIEAACTSSRINLSDFLGKSRKREIVTARILAALYLRKNNGLRLMEIGQIIGGKDHCTVLHYQKQYANLTHWRDPDLISAREKFFNQLKEINNDYICIL